MFCARKIEYLFYFCLTSAGICGTIQPRGFWRGGSTVEKITACCVTGHRPEKLPWGDREEDPRCIDLKNRLRMEAERAYEQGCRHFLSGMARGVDLYFAEIVLELGSSFPGVSLEAVIPYPEQAEGWPAGERERYQRLLEQCAVETVVQQFYTPGCLHRRDRYMVDRVSRLLAVYGGQPGGTRYTVHYALKQGVDVVVLEP